MNNSKNVEFDLFIPYYLKTDTNGITKESRYDLSALFKHISASPLINTKTKIFGDNHMFYKCVYHEGIHIWELQVLHLREQILPGFVDDNGEYALITLDEKQSPAESTTLLYNQESTILYVHRNVYGTTIRSLTGLLQKISPENTMVTLKPCMKNSAMEKVKDSSYYRQVILTVDSEQLSSDENNKQLGKIIKAFSTYNGKMVTINLGFGRKRRRFLQREETVELLHQAYEFPGTEKLI